MLMSVDACEPASRFAIVLVDGCGYLVLVSFQQVVPRMDLLTEDMTTELFVPDTKG